MERQQDNEFFVEHPPARREPPSRTPAIIGFLLGGAVILALGFIGSIFQNDEAAADVPALRLLGPVTGDTVENPVVLRFTTPADLRLQRDGWIAGELHLHAMADHRELMPGAADITTDGASFSWRLPPLQPGEHRVHLTWAGRNHGNISGATDTITIVVKGDGR